MSSPRGDAPRYAGLERLAPDARRLVVVGDTQESSWVEALVMEQNRARRPRLLAEIARRRPDAVLHLGDLVTWGSSRAHWARLDADLAPLRDAGVPVLPAVGNHDRMVWEPRARPELEARFAVLRGATWYAFRAAEVAFVALDSNFGALSRAAVAEQARWLDTTLAGLDGDPTVRAVVAYWHHPPWTNSRIVLASREARERFLAPLSASPKALAVFTGHCHGYERFRDAGLDLVVSGGGGGPRQPIETRPHKRRREDLFAAGGRLRFLHFCVLELGPDALHLEVVKMLDDVRGGIEFGTAETLTLPYRVGSTAVVPGVAASPSR